MPRGFPNRLGWWVGAAFGTGLVLGFGWALVRRHPASPYREALAEAIAEAQGVDVAEAREQLQDVLGGEEPLD